ncbi:cytoskeleton-associated protein 2 isoform X2 [Coturnix japonica]|uniref:cytoskeleton-associated protein 2 isoform X2 n=1 Tax=Coturnix japonica TaxID=93934 RepID=UPI000776B3EE|nr:cytoskeleton-associated protein 2 isoform X2 [Coturnix japonica]
MAARLPPQLHSSRRSDPTYREQRRQKVEEYLSRKKTFSGMPIHDNEASISRTRKATSNKLQDKTKLSASPKPEMEDKENANELSWDQSSRTSEENIILKSSTVTLASEMDPEVCASVNKGNEIKSERVLLSKSLQVKTIKEKQLTAEKHSSNVSLPRKPVLGTYRGRVIQSKINSFRKAPKSEGEKSSVSDEKLLTSATKPAVKSLSRGSCNVVLKTVKVTNYPNSAKPNCVLPLQSKQSAKPAINSQSSLNKQPSTSAVVPRKLTVQKTIGKRGPQQPRGASMNSDHGTLGVKKCEDLCKDGKPEAPAKRFSVFPSGKVGQDYKANNIKKSLFPRESAEERRVRLAEWRASRGKVMKRPPTSVLLGTQPKNEEQELAYTGGSLNHELNSEKVNKTLTECLQLAEQGCQGNKARAMLEELIGSIPGAKKLAKYWICWMRLEQMGPPEKLVAGYEEAILAGAMPRDELRRMLIDAIRNTENLVKSEDGGAVMETHLSEVVEISKELNSSVEQVHEAFKDLNVDDQKAENDDKKEETGNEMVKKEPDLVFKPEEILPKKNKKHKNRERRKKGKCERKEQSEDKVKDTAQTVNSPEKNNDTGSLMSCNPSTNPCLESVKMHYGGDDSDLKMITPLRYSLRIREKMYKYSDTPRDSHVSSSEQLQELESKATALIHEQNDKLEEASAEVEE